MRSHFLRTFVLASLLGHSIPTHATTSAYADFYIPYKQIQSDYTCLTKMKMEAVFGIPLASILEGVFAETKIYQQSMTGPGRYANINLLANETTRLAPEYHFDRYHDNGVYDYSFSIDLMALNTQNGSSTDGRQKTIDTAKLAVIAIVKTAELTHKPGKFRVWIQFENMPSTHGLSGSALYQGGKDWPVWPYTSSGSLYQQYLAEMIHKDC